MINAGLEAFLAVANTLNITRAAEQLNLAQSTVSKRLKDLEDEIGTPLVQRVQGSKSLLLTPEGEEFHSIAVRCNTLWNEALTLKSAAHKLSLSIGSLESLNHAVFPPLYRLLSLRRPRIRLSVTTTHSAELYDLVDRQTIDVGFGLLERSHVTVRVEPYYKDPMVVLRLGSVKQSSAQPIHPHDLNPEHELRLFSDPSFKIWHDYWWNPQSTNWIYLDNTHLVFHFLCSEEQWAIIPLSVAKLAESRGNYSIFPLAESPPERIIYRLTPKYPKASTIESLEILDYYSGICVKSLGKS